MFWKNLKLDLPVSRKWAEKIENFEKKIHGTFSGSKLLADSKNVHVL
jgi:hypothetical protein